MFYELSCCNSAHRPLRRTLRGLGKLSAIDGNMKWN